MFLFFKREKTPPWVYKSFIYKDYSKKYTKLLCLSKSQ